VPELPEALGQGDHVVDVLGRARVDVRREDVHERLVGVEGGLVGVRDVLGGTALEPGGDEPLEELGLEQARELRQQLADMEARRS